MNVRFFFFHLAAVFALVSCAAPTANLPSTNFQDKEAIRRDHILYGLNYAKQRDNRIQNIHYRIIKNTGSELCDRKLRPALGFDYAVHRPQLSWWQTLSSEQKQADEDLKEINPTAEDNSIYVRYVVSGSAADKAGLKEGDRILSVFGVSVPGGNGVRTKFKELMDENLKPEFINMPVEIEISRQGKIMTLTLTPDEVCPYPLLIDKSSHMVNAFSDGDRIYLTEEIIDYLQDDNDLAGVLSHELAHNTLGHIESQQINMAVGAFAGAVLDVLADTDGSASLIGTELGANAYSVDFEKEADYVSAYYMVRAGYDYKRLRALQKKLAARDMSSVYSEGITHPQPQERYALLTETAAEIDLKKNFKEELLPDFKTRNSHLEDKRD